MDDLPNPWARNSEGYDEALVALPQYSYHIPTPPTAASSMRKFQIAPEVMPQNSTSQPGGETNINFWNVSRDMQQHPFASMDAWPTSATSFEELEPSLSEPTYVPWNFIPYIRNITCPQAQNPSWTGSNANTPFGEAGFAPMATSGPSEGNIQYSGPGHATISDSSLDITVSTLASQAIHPPGSLEAPGKTNNNIKFSHTLLAPPKTCAQCKAPFRTHGALKKHADTNKHVAYKCTCEAKFSRLDCLNRHIHDYVATIGSSQRAGEVENGAQDGIKGFMQGVGKGFPCLYCSKYVGEKAFTRKYHLTQHLEGYHKFERGRVTPVVTSNL